MRVYALTIPFFWINFLMHGMESLKNNPQHLSIETHTAIKEFCDSFSKIHIVIPVIFKNSPQNNYCVEGFRALKEFKLNEAHGYFKQAYDLKKVLVSDFDLRKGTYTRPFKKYRHPLAPSLLISVYVWLEDYFNAFKILQKALKQQRFEQRVILRFLHNSLQYLAVNINYKPAQNFLDENPLIKKELIELEKQKKSRIQIRIIDNSLSVLLAQKKQPKISAKAKEKKSKKEAKHAKRLAIQTKSRNIPGQKRRK